jgi:hypothetical protein
MSAWKHGVLCVVCGALLATPVWAREIVDRIVANVNGHILLQSDWDEELAFEAFLNARPVESFTAEERKAALDRLIDQELLREQVKPPESASAEQLAGRLAEIRKLHKEATTEELWRAALAHNGLTENELEKRLSADLQLMRLVEARLRPSIQIDAHAVESYYREHLLPELQRAGSGEVPLPQVFGRIKDLLSEQKLNQLLASWLASLRSESRIQRPESNAGEQSR